MTFIRQEYVKVICDRCGEREDAWLDTDNPIQDEDRWIADLVEAGWVKVEDDIHHCPVCAKAIRDGVL